MNWFVTSLRENPELAIFLTLAVGFVIGRVRIGSFRLGNVVGTLLAGVLVGQLDVKIDPLVKTVFFALFLFATGYKVGPQFFRGLKKNAASQALLTLVLCVVSLVTTVVAAKVMGYDAGTAAGLLAGAFTESTVIGTAGNTISRLGLPEAETTRLLNNIPVAYAVSYLVGTSFVVWFLSSLAPRLLAGESQGGKPEARGPGGGRGEARGRRALGLPRVGRAGVPHPGCVGRAPCGDVEGSFAPARVFLRAAAAGAGSSTSPRTRAPARRPGGGRGAPSRAGRGGASLRRGGRGPRAARRPDGGARRRRDAEGGRRAAARGDRRGARPRRHPPQARPRGRGDPLRAGHRRQSRGPAPARRGPSSDVERAGKAIGYIERPSSETDVVFVGLGILLGGLFGALTLRIGDLPISLTASGGALIMGLVFGWLRSVRPTFGRIPEPALWIFDTIGLAVFIGCVGLAAGPSFVAGLRTTGPGLVVVSLLVALTPHLSAVLFGHYVLKMNPVLLLGACSGAGTATAALRAVQDEAGSKLPVLGYTVPYAIGNILLTAWGPVIVILTR